MNEFDVPVLFIVFNRPDLTKKTFDRIKSIKPKKLYIAADGPRDKFPEDKQKCFETRSLILNRIGWECELNTLFNNINLGCGKAPSNAITWFFEQEESGIIIEDDILVNNSFFHFCKLLLKKYEQDSRVMHIAGSNHGLTITSDSYYFSKRPHVWGWATWKRAWDCFDYKIKSFNDFQSQIYHYFGKNDPIINSRIKSWEKTLNESQDIWDYRWFYALIVNNGLSILPSTSLVTNLGFNSEATHTKTKPINYEDMKSEIEFPLKHPRFILPRVDLDNKYFELERKNTQWFKRFIYSLIGINET